MSFPLPICVSVCVKDNFTHSPVLSQCMHPSPPLSCCRDYCLSACLAVHLCQGVRHCGGHETIIPDLQYSCDATKCSPRVFIYYYAFTRSLGSNTTTATDHHYIDLYTTATERAKQFPSPSSSSSLGLTLPLTLSRANSIALSLSLCSPQYNTIAVSQLQMLSLKNHHQRLLHYPIFLCCYCSSTSSSAIALPNPHSLPCTKQTAMQIHRHPMHPRRTTTAPKDNMNVSRGEECER